MNHNARCFMAIEIENNLHYLRYAEKNTFDTSNLLIITREQIDRAIDESVNRIV